MSTPVLVLDGLLIVIRNESKVEYEALTDKRSTRFQFFIAGYCTERASPPSTKGSKIMLIRL